MKKNLDSKSFDELLAEADELTQTIQTNHLKDLEEEHLMRFEIHAQNLEKIKSKIHDDAEKKGSSEPNAGAGGMHEAIEDIVTAMRDFHKKIF